MQSPRRKVAGIALGVLVVALFAIVAVAQGFGHPSPSGDEIAIVEDADDGSDVAITQAELDSALEETATRQGLEEVPAADDPQYEPLLDSAFADLLLEVWVKGEAQDRGIEATEAEIDAELDSIKEQQFEGNDRQFERFLEESGFTEEEARGRIELQLLSEDIQGSVLPEDPPVDDDEIEAFYDANPDQFEQPETRNVRVILTEEESDAADAADELEADPSQSTWRQVARDVSIDETTQANGGLREGVVEGQSEQALDEQIFTAPTDEIVGPFAGEAGFYVIQVEEVIPGQEVSLEEASDQIRQTLQSARQQQAAQDFQDQFLEKWTSRTFCAEDFRMDRCANADAPADQCTEEVAEAQGCPAPVPSTRPIEPGTAGVFGAPAPQGRPQGPLTPVSEQPPAEGIEGLPPELEQIPEGAPPGQGAPPGEQPPPPPPPPPPPDE